jgi:ribonuclease HII
LSVDLVGVPLAELRARLEAAKREPLRRLLAALRRDARAGARGLAREFERRAWRAREEHSRLDRLFALEDELRAAGAAHIAGVDEVGMGPLAGPVVAAAVILPAGARIQGLRDSKQLSAAARERLAAQIRELALDLCVASVEVEEIDRLNIYRAGLEAMRRAVSGLSRPPDRVLVDARTIPEIGAPQQALVRGDASVGSIAAASIVAKVQRDARMQQLDREFPGYGFARNAGYATEEHRLALRERGPSAVHRRSFGPVAEAGQACRTR